MGEVLTFTKEKKPSPPIVPRVCGNCEFFTKKFMANECDAYAGDYAIIAWRRCQGTYWMKKRTWFTKIKELFS